MTLFVTADNKIEYNGEVYREIRTNVPPTGGNCLITTRSGNYCGIIEIRGSSGFIVFTDHLFLKETR